MFYAWRVDEGAVARQPGSRFARNNVLPSEVFRFNAVVALARHHLPSPWAVEEQSDCLVVPGL
jgi:hypothetical protein